MTNDHLSLSADDIAVLKSALKLFLTNDIEGVSSDKKKENTSIARSVIKKLDKNHNNFSAENVRIIISALMYFQMVITDSLLLDNTDTKFNADSEKYLSISQDLLTFFENSLHSAGFIN